MVSKYSSSDGSTLSQSCGGCQPITWTPRQTKSDPVPPLPQDILSSPMVNNSTHIHAGSSQQDLDGDDDDDDEVDSFDLTPELQHVGLHSDKGLSTSQSANNNITSGFLDTTVQQQQQAIGNLNHVSSPTSPVAAANTSGAAVGVPVIPQDQGSGKGKIVVAVYPFTAIEEGDLTLTKGMDNGLLIWWSTSKLNTVSLLSFLHYVTHLF